MKFTKILTAAAVASLAVGVHQASAASATAQAGGTIISALTIEATMPLDFGSIVAGDAASTVVISAAGGLTCGSGLTCLGSTQAAAFSVNGEANHSYSVSLPTSSISLSSGSDTMSIDNFDSSNGANGTLGDAGEGNFTVGGTLNVGASQAAGAYTGTFDVTVEYN